MGVLDESRPGSEEGFCERLERERRTCTAIANAYRLEERPIGSAPHIWCVTAGLNVTYLRPTPLDGPVTLRARIMEAGPKKTMLTCRLFSKSGEECARGEVVAVRVPPAWLREGSEVLIREDRDAR